PGRGRGANVFYEPGASGYPLLPSTHPKATVWDREMLRHFQAEAGRASNRPSDVTLFHELVHADDIRRGVFFRDNSTFGATVSVEEERATGVGDFAATNPLMANSFSENSYRADRDLPPRTFYVLPDERYSTAHLRGVEAEAILTAHTGAPGTLEAATGDVPPVRHFPHPNRPALVHLMVETDHNHGRNGVRDGQFGHAWLALEVPRPEDVPDNWRLRFPDHYRGLVNAGRIPLGHHVGFYPPPDDLVGALAQNLPGEIQIELGRDLFYVAGIQTYEVSIDQMTNILTFVDDNRRRRYNGFSSNCVNFAYCALESVGLTPPPLPRMRAAALPNDILRGIEARRVNGDPLARTTRLVSVAEDMNGVYNPPVRVPERELVPNAPPVPLPVPPDINGRVYPRGNVALDPIPPPRPVDPTPPVLPPLPALEPIVLTDGCG
ncbi:MAG TPA: M91 family zinc metallopeptidase, partial [Polyangia bacterium]